MIVYVNEKKEIKDVGVTDDVNLISIEVDDEYFKDWPVAKICCYKVILHGGKFAGYTPYVDTKVIEHIERLAKKSEKISKENAMLTVTVDTILTDIIPSLGM